MAFVWPTKFLLVTMAFFVAAIVVPWMATRRRAIVAAATCVIASATWCGYEMYLHSLARPGDPLIRIDLFLLGPMFCIAWVQAVYIGLKRLVRN